MVTRRRSQSELPNAPLALLHPLNVQKGTVPGAEIINEIASAEAIPLLVVFRAALAWSQPQANGPAFAFDPREIARIEIEALSRLDLGGCWPALAVIANGLVAPQPDRGDLAQACFCVVEWALASGAENTALEFAMLASLVWPWHPRYAWAAARLLRGRGRLREAETWFTRAYRVSVWMGDRITQAKSLASLGVLSYISGNYGRAERRLQRARRVASRHGLKLMEGEVLHDLFVLEMERRRLTEAEAYAARALECYLPANHERIPALAHDTACLWMDQGHFARALPVFQSVVRFLKDPGEMFQTYAATARAAGGAGEVHSFAVAWTRAFELAQEIGEDRLRAAALVDLGRGAASLSRWDEARRAFSEALSIARKRGEGDVQLKAEAGLESVERYAAADVEARVFTPEQADRDEVAEILIQGVSRVRAKEPPAGEAPSSMAA